jgi:hypothetical protein
MMVQRYNGTKVIYDLIIATGDMKGMRERGGRLGDGEMK